MSREITVSISYLDAIEVDSGKPAKHGDGRYVNGLFVPRVPTRAVEPTTLTVAALDDRIATIEASWGDRVERGESPRVYGTLTDGAAYQILDGQLRVGGYDVEDVALLAAVLDAQRQVSAAWLAAIADRPDVAAVVEQYRVRLDALDRAEAEHRERWARDCIAIARRFRRASVQVGEQTVPGKCCVRSARGTLLGYADVWDGRWLGTVERV
jgi:hypothetical protein